ncbi:IclR family transcriptional regulator [Natribacillus halophilus]|uniref:DNA-binding transcriptional regulator, IclR family n=1 Tax=Natribacillus halophilus TaxID=549003 RepID=A0A1G8R9Z2_9BACI|nr:IclR family transcriptional regulator [Natribacillus halophilus]SDJ13874.1 DNA-binding transcriptional regulator, IclR family [Natribacillus halophilus]
MNQSVVKALKLLDFFSDQEKELSLSEITKRSDMSKSTVYRLLVSLEECGFLRKVKNSDQDIRYSLGLKLLELGHIVSEQLELRNVALPHMRELSQTINEIVHLVILDGEQATYIEKVESSQALRLYTRVGKSSPLYIGSGPKLLFAYMPQAKQERMLEQLEIQPLTPNSHTSKEELQKNLKTVYEQGYSVSQGEQDLDTTGISFPIRDYSGEVVAVITVSGPTTRFQKDRQPFIKEETKKAADKISSNLGFK